jgi:hypothetical protein
MTESGELFCTDCSAPKTPAGGACALCGSTAVTRKLTVIDTLGIKLTDYVGLRVGPKIRSGNRQRFQRERIERPALWRQDPTRPAVEVQDINRAGNNKIHEVRDADTGEVLHLTEEPLDEATGRGSDKPALRAKRKDSHRA